MKIRIIKENNFGAKIGDIISLPPQMAIALINHFGVAEKVIDDEDIITEEQKPERDKMVRKHGSK